MDARLALTVRARGDVVRQNPRQPQNCELLTEADQEAIDILAGDALVLKAEPDVQGLNTRASNNTAGVAAYCQLTKRKRQMTLLTVLLYILIIACGALLAGALPSFTPAGRASSFVWFLILLLIIVLILLAGGSGASLRMR